MKLGNVFCPARAQTARTRQSGGKVHLVGVRGDAVGRERGQERMDSGWGRKGRAPAGVRAQPRPEEGDDEAPGMLWCSPGWASFGF